jgi:micrococcal nuclease
MLPVFLWCHELMDGRILYRLLLITMGTGSGYYYKAKIVSVYDGDTCRADIELGFGVVLENKTIRLANIDTAEIRGNDKEGKERAYEARDRLRDLVLGKEVTLQTIKDRTGKYGRIIGTIYLGGKNINEMLIDEGLAERMVRKKPRNGKKENGTSTQGKKSSTKEEKKEESLAVKIEIPESVIQSIQSTSGSS